MREPTNLTEMICSSPGETAPPSGRGSPGAVVPEEGEDGSLRYLQADAVEHHLVADGFTQPCGRDRWWGSGFMVPRLWCGAQANTSPSNSGARAMRGG